MKRRVVTGLFVLALARGAAADDGISPTEASKHVGEQETVCGVVASAKYAQSSRGAPTFLNLDKPYPNEVFTAVIWGEARPRFSTPPEVLSGKAVCVSGKIAVYRGRAEIVVSDPNQIREVHK